MCRGRNAGHPAPLKSDFRQFSMQEEYFQCPRKKSNMFGLGISYAFTRQYEEAITWCEKAVHQHPDDIFAHYFLTVVYSFSGRDEEARAEAAEVLRINPKFSVEKFAKRLTYRNQ